ncbi:MAG: phosphate acyltransferase PlsX [Dehalococcoidia bacterium]|nr:phosphate acyltransferase PlsX [Dehalococcoidia bacterium]
MGGDHGPEPIAMGGIEAARRFGIRVTLVGPHSQLTHFVDVAGGAPPTLSIVAAEEWIAMDEEPVQAARRKKEASINVGLGLVRSGEADAFVSAGSTGAVMAASLFSLGRLRGCDRPAIAAFLPHRQGGVLLIDVGANVECRPQHLLQFAHMGSAYLERVMGRKEPRVGLLSVGEESTKGTDTVQEAHRLLTRSPLNFIGNVEGKDLPSGMVDVVVTDGFTGNVVLKAAEGIAGYVVSELKHSLKSRLDYKLAGKYLAPGLRKAWRSLDYTAYGGAPLLGVNGIVIICHGRSSATAITRAVEVAGDAASRGLLTHVQETLRS